MKKFKFGNLLYYLLLAVSVYLCQQLLFFILFSDKTIEYSGIKEIYEEKIDIPDEWIPYQIKDIAKISIPPDMEDRDEQVSMIVDTVLSEVLEKNLDKARVVFQPKEWSGSIVNGTVDFPEYERIILNTKKGETFKWNENFSFSKTEEKNLDEYFKQGVLDEMKQLKGNEFKLVKWFPSEFLKINGLSAIKISFTRQMDSNPIVKVERYTFFNSIESVDITISYRLDAESQWRENIPKILQSFDFLERK